MHSCNDAVLLERKATGTITYCDTALNSARKSPKPHTTARWILCPATCFGELKGRGESHHQRISDHMPTSTIDELFLECVSRLVLVSNAAVRSGITIGAKRIFEEVRLLIMSTHQRVWEMVLAFDI